MDTLDIRNYLYFQRLMLGIKRISPGEAEEMYFHTHTFSELVIVLESQGCCHWAEGKWAQLKRGDVLLLRQEEVHAYEHTRSLHLINLLFDVGHLSLPLLDGSSMEIFHLLNARTTRPGDAPPECPVASLNEEELQEIISLADALEMELQQTLPGKQLRCFALFTDILVLLGRKGRTAPSPDATDALEAAVTYLNRHFREKISVAKLARIACLSERALFLKFRRQTGCSPQEYRLKKQIEYAAALLKSSRDSLERIAAECGFCDANHLSKRFTAVMGLPPGTFRRNCRKENGAKS